MQEATSAPPKPPRNLGIDAFRYLLAFPVVLIHAAPSDTIDQTGAWGFWLTLLSRVSVPYFFIVSGSFLRPSGELSAVLKTIKRLAPIYLFWLTVYELVFLAQGGRPHLTDLLTGGSGWHLWFLPALAIGLIAISFGIGRFGWKATAIVCVLLTVVALARGPYHEALGLPGTAKRGRVLMAPLMVFLGWWLARGRRIGFPTALLLVVMSYGLVVLEEFGIARLSHEPAMSHDFIPSTIMLGVSAFLMARAVPETTALARLATLGGISLTVYTSHLAILLALQDVWGRNSLAVVLTVSAVTFLIASVVGLVIQRIPLLKPISR